MRPGVSVLTNERGVLWSHRSQPATPQPACNRKRPIGAGKPALWRCYTPMWVEGQREALPLWTWWAPPYTSYESPQTRCDASNGWAHTTSHSCNTRSGPTSQTWKVTKPDNPSQPMGKYVRCRTCFGARRGGPCRRAHHEGTRPRRPPKQVEYVPGTTVPAVLLLAPNGLKATLRPGSVRGNLWMLPPPTARPFCPPPLSQDKLTGTPTTCWRCGPQALATPWPILQLLARNQPIPTANATP